MARCEVKDCQSIARWSPTIVIRAALNLGPAPAARMALRFDVCDAHQPVLGVNDLLNDLARWEYAEKFKQAQGLDTDWSRATVEWQGLIELELKRGSI